MKPDGSSKEGLRTQRNPHSAGASPRERGLAAAQRCPPADLHVSRLLRYDGIGALDGFVPLLQSEAAKAAVAVQLYRQRRRLAPRETLDVADAFLRRDFRRDSLS